MIRKPILRVIAIDTPRRERRATIWPQPIHACFIPLPLSPCPSTIVCLHRETPTAVDALIKRMIMRSIRASHGDVKKFKEMP